jgi:hypothetical protein
MRKDGSANISAKKEGLTHTEARRSFAIMVQQRGLKPEQAKRLPLESGPYCLSLM